MTNETGFHRRGEIVEGIAILLTARLDQREHRLDEPTTLGALSSKGQLSPDDCVT